MRIVRHRLNQVSELGTLAAGIGAELDLRTSGNEILLSHDPFQAGERFEDYAAAWRSLGIRGTMVLNPKEDGLESRVCEILERYGIEDYFMIDVTVPAAVRLSRAGFRRYAVRVSEYESVECALRFAGMADWVWVDCFSGKAASVPDLRALRRGFRVCLVAPELHGYPPEGFFHLASEVDAVCTKYPHLWAEALRPPLL